VKHPVSSALVLCAALGLLGACGGGGGGGGEPTPPAPTVDPPTVVAHPQPATVTEGESAAFEVVATGDGTVTFQWRVSDDGGTTWTPIGGATAALYDTPPTTLADDGDRFSCVVSNEGGSVTSDAALLTVDPAVPYVHTIAIDGTDDFTPEETFESTTLSSTGRITWDADYVYVGMNAPQVAENNAAYWFLVYVGGTPGTTAGVVNNTQQPTLPFDARYHVRWRGDGGATSALVWSGSSWDDAAWDFTGDVAANGTFLEMRLPRADLGDPSTLSVHLCLVDDTTAAESTFAGVPNGTFTDGYDPAYTSWFAFDLTGPNPPAFYVPLP